MTGGTANDIGDSAKVAANRVAPVFRHTGSPLEVLLVFFKLGLSCFGGPSGGARTRKRSCGA